MPPMPSLEPGQVMAHPYGQAQYYGAGQAQLQRGDSTASHYPDEMMARSGSVASHYTDLQRNASQGSNQQHFANFSVDSSNSGGYPNGNNSNHHHLPGIAEGHELARTGTLDDSNPQQNYFAGGLRNPHDSIYQ